MPAAPNIQDANIFFIETRFQRLARRIGGIPRERAIEQAQNHIEEIKVGFDEWLNRELQNLANLVRQARSGETECDWIDVANFHSRQLRDVGTTMDSELLTFIANALCEILDAVTNGAECNFESISCHIEALCLAQHKPYRYLKPDRVPELTKGLRRVVDHVSIVPINDDK